MTTDSRLAGLLHARELLGPTYGSEHLCVLLYALARRERPAVVVELGTGLGVTTAWLAAALEENGHGHLWSIDDGSHLTHLDPALLDGAARSLGFHRGSTLGSFAAGLLDANGLRGAVTLVEERIDLAETMNGRVSWPFLDRAVDWVFSDIWHGPAAIGQLLATFLPCAAEAFSLFVDSASTHTAAFLMAERTVDQLNRGKLPRSFTDLDDPARVAALERESARREFRLTHLVERANRPQNSTMWITAHPVDWRPYPLTMMRGG